MGTRSMIGVVNENGTVTATYCHYDGYLSHNGALLVNHYNSDIEAVSLANVGYLSALGPNIHEAIAYSAHCEEPVIFESVEDYMNDGADWADAEYLYLWDGYAWFVSECHANDKRFTDVETMLKEAA